MYLACGLQILITGKAGLQIPLDGVCIGKTLQIDAIPGMNQQQFIKLFDLNVRQPVIANPNMLRKFYWK